MATANTSLKQGPRMYARHFIVNDLQQATATASSTTTASPSSIKTHVIYYTKQYDQSLDGGDGSGGQNAFDLNDEEEHRFMHDGNTEENVIDDGRQMRKVKR